MSDFLKQNFDTWYEPLKDILESEYFVTLGKKINYLYKNSNVCPQKEDIFKAFKLCSYDKVKVVILGQDPYHDIYDGKPRATGLAFANPNTVTQLSPSLKNIMREVETDVSNGLLLDMDITLESWAEQGVLLLNTALTVQQGKPASHTFMWEEFTKDIIKHLSDKELVWVLLGNHAKSFKQYMENTIYGPITVEAAHPSPLSAHKGFFGSKVFSKTNSALFMLNKKEIDWKYITPF